MSLADAFQRLHILVVGDVMLDRYWFGDVNRISPEAPVPVISIKVREERPGGAANVASNITTLGARCSLLSVVGDDEAGKCLTDLLEDSGIEAILHRDSHASTTVKLRMVSKNQQLLRADFERQPRHEILAQCLQDFHRILNGVDAVVISDYAKGGLLHIKEMISAARSASVPILIDPKGSDFSRYSGATMITPNLNEFQSVVGDVEDDLSLEKKALQLTSELDVDYLLITRSNKGMSLASRRGNVIHSPARAKEVYDVSGAGDTVISTMALCHAAGLGDVDKLTVANAAAGIVIGKLGTATVSAPELHAALNEIQV